MEIKWLEDFVTLADTWSFSRAAELRNVTQPAFSRRIKQLEGWLGATLISRATMPAELTPAGRNFLPIAQEAIRTFYAARESLRPSHEEGLIRFAALHTLTVTIFPRWLKLLEKSGGAFSTSLMPDRGGIEANLDALIGDEADFFLTYAHSEVPFHLDRGQFSSLTIAHDRLIPLAAANVSIPGGTLPGLHILDRAVAQPRLAVPYLSYGFNSFFGVALSRLMLRRPPFRRRTTHENTISAGLMNMAVTGAGVCWLPESLARDVIEAGDLVPASADTGWNLDLEIRLYRHAAMRSRRVEDLWHTAKLLLEREPA
ncbi:LysR family transcriptional regulator [Ensifer adhaerens]|uniref:LysR family transcriptional regulator n=1 Tax=Ensifer TaxID=106591 RepID=UPI001A4E72E0|nr:MULTISPECIES: LysR family transcriptional regulator [Ensifer]MBK5571477.1 LysR family transcriptional regulator [Ensifer sp. SSB1]MBZ7926206.1 LysR family transcriptional regulator [Ensifer adhaerens]UAX97427.1 LysR family transcriptional regulator [Ensifer adhaerens]UAY03454.1 LysR family transcriptional regulator [Ensifer adhaerens]UAY11438.1 LysR family transcriptional regulator [Ensifer adhaerens]